MAAINYTAVRRWTKAKGKERIRSEWRERSGQHSVRRDKGEPASPRSSGGWYMHNGVDRPAHAGRRMRSGQRESDSCGGASVLAAATLGLEKLHALMASGEFLKVRRLNLLAPFANVAGVILARNLFQ
jgi:hypothetical protein